MKLIQTGSFNRGEFQQIGSYNIAHATQNGGENAIFVRQLGDNNTMLANFTGDRNGVGYMSGFAGALELESDRLVQGATLQDSNGFGAGNSITFDVDGNDNRFAFAQIGGGNSITGTVGSAGASSSNNQVAVLQTGAGNATTFSQNGGGNNLAVSQ